MSLAWSFSVLSHKTSHKLFQGKLSQPGRKHGQQVLETLWNHHWQLGFVFTLLTCFQLPLPNTGNVQRRSECQHLGGVRTRYVGRKPNRRSCIPQASVITFCICNRLILSVCMVHLLRIPGGHCKGIVVYRCIDTLEFKPRAAPFPQPLCRPQAEDELTCRCSHREPPTKTAGPAWESDGENGNLLPLLGLRWTSALFRTSAQYIVTKASL